MGVVVGVGSAYRAILAKHRHCLARTSSIAEKELSVMFFVGFGESGHLVHIAFGKMKYRSGSSLSGPSGGTARMVLAGTFERGR
jgi:hypothetical protein